MINHRSCMEICFLKTQLRCAIDSLIIYNLWSGTGNLPWMRSLTWEKEYWIVSQGGRCTEPNRLPIRLNCAGDNVQQLKLLRQSDHGLNTKQREMSVEVCIICGSSWRCKSSFIFTTKDPVQDHGESDPTLRNPLHHDWHPRIEVIICTQDKK